MGRGQERAVSAVAKDYRPAGKIDDAIVKGAAAVRTDLHALHLSHVPFGMTPRSCCEHHPA